MLYRSFVFTFHLLETKRSLLRCRNTKNGYTQQQIAAYLKLLYSAISDLVRGKT